MTPADRVRIGLIGAGRIVREHHVPAYLINSDLLEVRAVADPANAGREAVGDALGIPARRRHASLADLLAQGDLDLVVVASPPAAHHEAVTGALARRIAVVSEKPLGLDQAELDRVRIAAAPAGFVAVVHNYLTKPGWQHLINLVRADRIGRPVMVRFEELADDHWRLPKDAAESWRQRPQRGGGPLRDNLYHALYLAEEILGSPLRRAAGEQAALLHDYPAGDTAVIAARHRNGTLTQATAAWSYLGQSRAVAEVLGTKGVLTYRYWAEPDRLRIDSPAGPAEVVPVPGWSEALDSGYAAFFRATAIRFRSGQPPLFTIGDAERIMRAIGQVPGPAEGKESGDG